MSTPNKLSVVIVTRQHARISSNLIIPSYCTNNIFTDDEYYNIYYYYYYIALIFYDVTAGAAAALLVVINIINYTKMIIHKKK